MDKTELKNMVAQIGQMAQTLQESAVHDPANALPQLASLVANLAGVVSLVLSDGEEEKETSGGKTGRRTKSDGKQG